MSEGCAFGIYGKLNEINDFFENYLPKVCDNFENSTLYDALRNGLDIKKHFNDFKKMNGDLEKELLIK